MKPSIADDEIVKLKRLMYSLSQIPIDSMGDRLEEFDRQCLVDLTRKILSSALSGEVDMNFGKRRKQKLMTLADEDICARLRARQGFMLTDEVARTLRYNPETIYRWIREKGLPATKFRGERIWKFDGARLAEWWEQGTRR
jgi:excisionase family DNA binding protein